MASALTSGGGGISQTAGDARYVKKAGDTMTGPLLMPAGSVGAPAVAGSGDTDTGVTFPGSNIIGLNVGGAEILEVTSTGLQLISASSVVRKVVSGGATTYGAYADGVEITFNAGDGAIVLRIPMSGLVAPSTTTGMVLLATATGSTVGAAGAATVLPIAPLGYITTSLANGTPVKIPYYNT